MKTNYIILGAGVLAFASLLAPWFTIELWTDNYSSTMSFAAYLYLLTGTVEGSTKSMFLLVWFNAAALVLMLSNGLICIASLVLTKNTRKLLGVSFILALLSMGIFAYGLACSSFAIESLNPGYTLSQFPQGTFGLSPEQSMLFSYDYSWAIGLGFWVALASAILALIGAIVSKK